MRKAAEMESTTDWARVVELYDMLREHAPSLVVDVNRALAIAMKSGTRQFVVRGLPLRRIHDGIVPHDLQTRGHGDRLPARPQTIVHRERAGWFPRPKENSRSGASTTTASR